VVPPAYAWPAPCTPSNTSDQIWLGLPEDDCHGRAGRHARHIDALMVTAMA